MLPDGLSRWAPLIYLLVALPVMVFHALAMPPFQGADEDGHFLRVVALSRGELVGTRFSGVAAGGFVDRAAVEAAHRLDWLKFQPDRRATAEAIAEERRAGWQPVQVVPAEFGNTAIYPPWFYVPAVAAVLAARASRMKVADSLLLARLATGLVGAAVGVAALALARRGRALLFAVLALPMALALLGACSQDGLLIPACALAAALLGRADEWPRACAGAGCLLGMVVAARPPYAPLLLLAPLAALAGGDRARPGAPARVALQRAGAAAIAALIPLLWLPFGAAPAGVGFRPGEGASVAGQLAFLAADPLWFLHITSHTLAAFGAEYLRQFIGVLGWLDTKLPRAAYATAGAMLALAVVAGLAAPRERRPRWFAPACLLLLVSALATVGIAQYLSWTPVGALLIEGIQGRYAIPVALFLPLALPALGTAGGATRWARVACWGALYATAAASLWFVPMAIMARYYG